MDSSFDDVEVLVGEKIPEVVSPIATATLVNVDIGLTNTNGLKKFSKKKILSGLTDKDQTRIVSILNVSIANIRLDDLRTFASQVQIVGAGTKTKKNVCDMIIKIVIQHQTKIQSGGTVGMKTKTDKKKKRKSTVNRKRFYNVLFCDIISPSLSTVGEVLGKDKLTDGLKTDQVFHKKIACEYNTTSNSKYNDHTHPGLPNKSKTVSHNNITWQQSRITFKSLVKEYKDYRQKCTKSGNHGDFPDYVGNNTSVL